MTHFKNYYNDNRNNYILINCKAERNINNIELTKKNIIASTYDSCNIIIKLLNKINIEETLIIIDEFHNISQDMIINKKNHMNKILTSDSKILFVSATPLNTDNYKNIFGDIKYELTWNDAIKNKYICDYNFYYPNNNKIITKIDDLKIDKTIINKTILINKSYFLLESLKITNVKKCIVYLKTIKECYEFVKILKTINIYFELNLRVYEIICETTKKKRTEYLNKFKNDNNAINIICNVHVLDEGIDIPECDSVYLTHPNNNLINIIQRISRANRLDLKNKDKIAKIFLWSKNELKLKQITDNISKTIKIKYSKDNNDIINKYNKLENNIINIIKDENTLNKVMTKDTLINFYNTNNINKDNTFIEFIQTFYDIFNNEDDIYNNCIINIELIVKWLKCNKNNIKSTLEFGYKINDDYKLINNNKQTYSNGGQNKIDIYITLTCLKLLIMRSQKGFEFRNYYIQYDNLIHKYKNKLIQNLNSNNYQ
jgi:superfamily II DNA or RNA helicase